MFCMLLSLLVGIGGLTLISGLSAVLFYILAVLVLRGIAKADPIMSQVWFRHIKQQDYYPSRSSLWRPKGGFQC